MLKKYCVTQSDYFILATTVELIMEIKYGKLLFCHRISEGSVDNTFSMREYNNRTVYECFKYPFPIDCGRPDLNLPTIFKAY